MKLSKYLVIFSLLIIVFSCKSNKLKGSWGFIEVYKGVTINNIDTLQFKKNNSKKGTGILVFNDNQTFTSMDLKGYYQKKRNFLKLKYSNSKDTTVMKISYLDKNNLLLSSISEHPNTWFYRKMKK